MKISGVRFRSGVLVAALVAHGLTLVAQTVATGVHPISGRRFAQVMSAAGADWLDRPERVDEEAPDRAIAILSIPRGATVADVGAGSGYITIKLAARVGPTGKVYATDIQPEMLGLLRQRLISQR